MPQSNQPQDALHPNDVTIFHTTTAGKRLPVHGKINTVCEQSLTPHPTHNRSFQRQSSQPIT